MTGKVWISNVMSDSSIGNKQGLRAKFYGQEWEPAQHELDVPDEKVLEAHRRHKQGHALERTDFPEAVAVFDDKCFSKLRDLFMAGPFYAVKGKLAEVLSRFDLGEGGLLPLTIFQNDLTTPVDGNFFLLNFGARKNSFQAEVSNLVVPFYIDKDTKQQVWKIKSWAEDGDIVLSNDALKGADLWFEVAVYNKIFMSEALVDALRATDVKVDFRLKECRIVEAA